MKFVKISIITCLALQGFLGIYALPVELPGTPVNQDSTVLDGPVILKEFPLEIISPSHGIQYFKDGIIFLSNSKAFGKMSSKHISFGTIQPYYGIIQDSTVTNVTGFIPGTRLTVLVDAITFDKAFRNMYFTRISNGGMEKIYHAVFSDTDQSWQLNDLPESFCKNDYVYTHPALSGDGKIMVFASEKPGSVSGMDLYITRNTGNDWTEPKLFSSSVNSNGDELYPFLDQNNNLFYSSDGLPGFGGFDVYCSKFNGETWDPPVNLTRNINSEMDEISFKIDPKNEKSGFLTVKSISTDKNIKLFKLSLSDKDSNSGIRLADLLVNLALLEIDNHTSIPSQKEIKVDNKISETLTGEQTTHNDIETDTRIHDITIDQPVEKDQKSEQVNNIAVKTTQAEIKESLDESSTTTDNKQIQSTGNNALSEKVTEEIKEPEIKKPEIIYRVQFASSSKSKGIQTISIGGIEYKTWEYLYKGAYRSCIGEFETLAQAKAMQTKCRQSGYPQAFVVVFKNNERSLDPALFK